MRRISTSSAKRKHVTWADAFQGRASVPSTVSLDDYIISQSHALFACASSTCSAAASGTSSGDLGPQKVVSPPAQAACSHDTEHRESSGISGRRMRRARATATYGPFMALVLMAAAGLTLAAAALAQQTGVPAAAAPAVPAPSAAAAAAPATPASGTAGGLVISEVMFRNDGIVLTGGAGTKVVGPDGIAVQDPGTALDWVELHNPGPAPVALAGWRMELGRSGRTACSISGGISIPADRYAVVLVSSNAARLANATQSPPPGMPLVAGCEMSLKPGTLSLLSPGRDVSSRVSAPLPRQFPNVTFGLPAGGSSLTYLQAPTPGAANSAALQVGPFIMSITRDLMPQPAAVEDVSINITLSRNLAPVSEVVLYYLVDFGKEQHVVASLVEDTMQEGSGTKVLRYSAIIPGAGLAAGSMLRWRAVVKDGNGLQSTFPSSVLLENHAAAAKAEKGERYHGTVIGGAVYDVQAPDVPILDWFTPDLNAAATQKGAPGQALFFRGQLYDGVEARRRGVTAMLWPKPKLKFVLPDEAARGFEYSDSAPRVYELGLQSFWFELGERSYMKETLALQAMAAVGQKAPNSFHVHVRVNGKFYGLFSFVEMIGDTFLERVGLPVNGPLFKSVSGELSNLRWDLPLNEYPSYWVKENRKRQSEDWKLLESFALGLAGGDPSGLTRSKLLFDRVNLPAVINEMAVQTVLNNMDRCTKNFYMYRNPKDEEWLRLPWDMDGSFGQDNGLGGKPGNTYCVLACEQWNSPLYCDSEHTQDLERVTPWGTVTVPLHAGVSTTAGPQNQGPAVSNTRKMLAPFKAPLLAIGSPITKFPKPDGWDNPDRITNGTRSAVGAKGTYNHLVDAILDVKLTREMYLRRLRSVADQLLTSGFISKLANETLVRIKPLATADANKWNTGIDVERGWGQIVAEFLPIRTEQLLGSLYGPTGTNKLLPPAQPSDALTNIVLGRWDGGRPEAPGEQYMQIINRNPYAVDLTGVKLTAPLSKFKYTFPAGAVVPAGSNIFVASSVVAWRARAAPPQGGQGHLVLGSFPAILPADPTTPAPTFTLASADGKRSKPLVPSRKL